MSNKHHVFINVYDMLESNYLTSIGYYALGVGIFHSGVEINGKEYCFRGHDIPNATGVYVMEPKIGVPPELTLKHTIDMGTIELTEHEFTEILLSISNDYMGTSYNLLTRNCNHFTQDFIQQLTKKSIPKWINRAARIGNRFPKTVIDLIQPSDLLDDEI